MKTLKINYLFKTILLLILALCLFNCTAEDELFEEESAIEEYAKYLEPGTGWDGGTDDDGTDNESDNDDQGDPDTDGDGDPDSTDPDPNNPCIFTEGSPGNPFVNCDEFN